MGGGGKGMGGGGGGTGHGFWLSGNVLWCGICGAFAEGCGTMALARPCEGKRKVGSRQSRGQGGRNGLLQQLRNLQRGCIPALELYFLPQCPSTRMRMPLPPCSKRTPVSVGELTLLAMLTRYLQPFARCSSELAYEKLPAAK